MINEQGGINGRKINLIVRDDAYSPPKTVEDIRELVEQDHVGDVQHARHAAQLCDPSLRTDGRACLSISLDEAVAPCSFQCAAHSSRLCH